MKTEDRAQAPEVIRGFLGYLETIKGKSPKTVEEYYFDLRTFFRFMKLHRGLVDAQTNFEDISIADVDIAFIQSITLTDVYEYMNYIAQVRHNAAAARSRKVSSLRSFFKYLTVKTGQLKENPVLELDTPKLKKSLPKYLTLEQSLELLNTVDGPFAQRDYCMLTLLLNCGLRLSELVGINLSDLRSDRTLRIVGKGNKERMVYLNDACIRALEDYKKVRPVDRVRDKNALFLSKRLQRISPKTVQYTVKKYFGEIGLGQGYSTHKLRHTAATLMYQHGHVDIRVLKEILGHENLGTTEIYTHLSSQQMQDAVEASPLAQVKPKRGRPKKQTGD